MWEGTIAKVPSYLVLVNLSVLIAPRILIKRDRYSSMAEHIYIPKENPSPSGRLLRSSLKDDGLLLNPPGYARR